MKFCCVLCCMLCFSASYGQSWKQYADSASFYASKNNAEKAISFYTKTVEILKPDSASTRTYTSQLDTLANLLYATKQYAIAEKYVLEAKEIQEKSLGKENLEYAYSCSVLGNIYKDQGQYLKAVPLLEKTKTLREKLLGKDHLSYANACNNLGITYNRLGQFPSSAPLFLETKRVREKLLGKNLDYAGSCINVGFAYMMMGQVSEADSLFREAKEIQEKNNAQETPEYAISNVGLGSICVTRGQFIQAEPYYITAKQIREKLLGKENPDYASSCFSLGFLYLNLGLYKKAEPYLIEAMAIQKKVAGTENFHYAHWTSILANIYKNMAQYELAEALYLEAKQIIDRLGANGNPGFAATIRHDLGDFYRIVGRYDEAEKLLLESKPLFERTLGKKSPDYATFIDNLANLYLLIGQYEKSEALFVESKDIRKSFVKEQPLGYIFSSNNLAGLYMSMGDNEKALDMLLEAKEIVKDTGTSCLIYITLGNIYASMKKTDSAEKYYLVGKEAIEKMYGKEHKDHIAAMIGLGAVYLDKKQYQKAIATLEPTKALQEKLLGKQHPEYGSTCNNLGEVYWAMNKPALAEKNFAESFSASVNNLEAVFSFTNEKEKTAFIKNRSGEDDKAFSFYTTKKLKSGLPYSMALFHRNLILSSSKALKNELLSSNDTGLINKYNQWNGLKKYLSVLYSIPVADRKENVAELEEKAGLLEKELTLLSPGFKKQQQHIDWKDIKSNLKTGEAAVEFTAFRFYNGTRFTDSMLYAALVIRKEAELPAVHYLFNEKQLNDIMSPSRINSGQAVTELYASRGIIKKENIALSKSLYDLIWKPIENDLKGIKTVYFAPEGLLHRISFAALPINGTQVLSDHYQLVQLNSTASVAEGTPNKLNRFDKIILYGGISYDADSTSLQQLAMNYEKHGNSRSLPSDLNKNATWTKLEGTQLEINGIQKNGEADYSVTVLSGIEANEESVKALDGKTSPEVLHIASHGFFFPDPQNDKSDKLQPVFEMSGKIFKESDNPLFRSGLLFAGANLAWQGKPVKGIEDGILTAYEVSNMYLPNTKLVVLSACETALGDIHGAEGVYGLQRAFKMAGVQNLVMSLWKVPDAETAEFMQLFYKNMFDKQSISDAFYKAQSTMKNKYRKDPYKWAAWVLVR